jgi:hypothetical protein
MPAGFRGSSVSNQEAAHSLDKTPVMALVVFGFIRKGPCRDRHFLGPGRRLALRLARCDRGAWLLGKNHGER